jgi:hypothetical protein
MPVTSNLSENKVATGVRFAKCGRIIQLELEEAIALPEGGYHIYIQYKYLPQKDSMGSIGLVHVAGAIDEESRSWKLPEPIYGNPESIPANHIMALTYEHRSIDTDRLEAPSGHVVTGMRLRNLGGHLNLEASVTPISFSDGKLIVNRTTWIGNDNTPFSVTPRMRVDILNPGIPTRSNTASKIDTKHNEYIMFDSTSASKDVSFH